MEKSLLKEIIDKKSKKKADRKSTESRQKTNGKSEKADRKPEKRRQKPIENQ